MENLARQIFEVVKDYRNEDGIQITVDSVLAWAAQFGDEQRFMLEELCHLLPQVYFNKEKVKACLRANLNELYIHYHYTNLDTFLCDVEFLHTQGSDKSQTVMLGILDDIVFEKTGRHISDYQGQPKSLFVYLDDVLASGGTICRDVIGWLKTDNHIAAVSEGKIRLVVMVICLHSWGWHFLQYQLKMTFPQYKTDKILWGWSYEIQNHLKLNDQTLNIAIPVNDQPQNVKNYLSNLSADKYEEYAFREPNQPKRESFFTSPENRIRYENLLLQKGLEIISRIKGPVADNIRPLGFIKPRYKTFGLGTHFITWRNIPNNSPLVFWWDVPEHGWKPLFPPKRK